jgi:hypothetical protein
MKNRPIKFRLAFVACTTIVACWLTFGHEAKSALRAYFVNNAEGNRPYRHHRLFHLRIVGDTGTVYVQGTTTATVLYSDSDGKTTVSWKVVGKPLVESPTVLVLLLEPKDPRVKDDGKGFVVGPTGTGTIVVTTVGPATSTGTGIPVTAIDTDECP